MERRFPLRFEPESPTLRELYSQAKGLRWNPRRTSRGAASTRRRTRPPCARRRGSCGAVARGAPTRARREHRAPPSILPRVRRRGHGRQALPLLPPGRRGQAPRGLLPLRRAARRLRARTRARPSRGRAIIPSRRWPSIPTCRWRRFVAALGCLDDQLDLNLCLSHLQQSPRRDRAPGPAAHRRGQAAPRDLRVDAPRRPPSAARRGAARRRGVAPSAICWSA